MIDGRNSREKREINIVDKTAKQKEMRRGSLIKEENR